MLKYISDFATTHVAPTVTLLNLLLLDFWMKTNDEQINNLTKIIAFNNKFNHRI